MEEETKKTTNFIPRERGSLPRVLLLDCANELFQVITEAGFQVFQGKSGFVDGKREIPRDGSEIEIVFWDVSKFKQEYGLYFFQDDLFRATENDKLRLSGKTIEDFFLQIRRKGGFIGIFFGDNYPYTEAISSCLGLRRGESSGFSVGARYTHQIKLSSRKGGEDLFTLFFDRFVKDKNLKFSIHWQSNYVGADFYFIDEDGKSYAVVFSKEILISPKIEKLDKAVLFLLQEVLPNTCDENIYPDLHRYKWLENSFFKFPKIKKMEETIKAFKEKSIKQIQDKERELQNKKEELSYLHEMLYKDDSDLFLKGEKLKDIIKKVLEEDLGFQNVIDVDEERLVKGLSLKEDLRIGNEVFIEVKGTEAGAKANWEKDLMHHVSQYCAVTGANLLGLKKILIFNHERIKDPRNRTNPFASDPELLKSCEINDTVLIPVFELFKMVVDLKDGKISQGKCQKIILDSKGLFVYGLA